MAQIKLKRVYDPAESGDGFRVLVDRLWPRGLRKEDLHCDLWAKEIAPSTSLRQWFHREGHNHWEEFKRRYTDELIGSEAIKEFEENIKNKKVVTLLYASKDTRENQALVLRDYLEEVVG